MKHTKRLVALLLCLAMVVSLCGCNSAPQETTPPTTEPAPTEPPAEELYASARGLLESAEKITLDVMTTTTTTVADQEFTVIEKDILSYNGYGTDAIQASLKKSITNAHDPKVAVEDASIPYSEVYSDGTVYISYADGYSLFSAELTAEEAALRYVPAALLDASIYGDLSAEVSPAGTLITFASPSAAENWAIPEDAQMLDASGSAELDQNGALKKMTYTVTYQYGPATITKEVESKTRSDALSVVVPQDAAAYSLLQDADVVLTFVNGLVLATQAESATTSSMDSIFSAAAMVMRSDALELQFHDQDGDVSFLADTSVTFMNYGTNENETYKQKETYLDGKYVISTDGGVPTTQTGVSADVFTDYAQDTLTYNILSPEYWLDVTTTDLGSLYLFEFTCTEDFGNTVQNDICLTFWNDAAFLNKLASAYATNNVTAYAAYDKYTGLPTAAGYAYAGSHTIDGVDYLLTEQCDQSIRFPSLDAYYNITEKMLPEEEPENKATPLFYHVTGEDGQEMWLFGTIHVGDERTAYLPQEIYDAFSASDALALEFSSKAFEKKMEEDAQLQSQIASLSIYSDGTTLQDHLSKESYELLQKHLKATGNFNSTYTMMKPSILTSFIENFYLAQAYQLTSMQGCESRLEELAAQQEKEVLDVESALAQTQMMVNWSDELQEIMLEDILEYDPQEYWQETYDLYEKWCAGDEAALRELLSDEVDLSELTAEEVEEYEAQKPYIEEYNKTMSYDRNDGMLEVAKQYLESGDTIFFAVGLAHLLNDVNGLVNALQEAGYTVELVSYT